MLRDEDRRQIQRELIVAILGIVIGAVTTFLNKFIESEYQYQRNLSVIEYSGDCKPGHSSDPQYPYAADCSLRLQASGPKPIAGVRLTVTAQPGAPVVPVSLTPMPSFAPPDVQVDTNSMDMSSASIYLTRMRDPQQITWNVSVNSKSPIDVNSQIVRTAAVENESAQIEGGNSWRWKRWLPLGMVALILPAVIASLVLFTMFGLRHRPRRKSSNEKTGKSTNEDEETM